MLIENAFWVASRTAGVAEHARRAFIAVGPLGIPVVRRDPILKPAGRIVTDIVFDRCPLRFKPVNDWLKHSVIEQNLILSMIGDIDQLFVEQPWIDRVEDTANANRAVPADQMAAVVHCKGRDAVTRFYSRRAQSLCHPERIPADTRPVRARFAAICPA